MKVFNKLLILVLLLSAPLMVQANESGVHLDKAPIDLQNTASLQRGAILFASRCLACHSASYMRYNRLLDIGMTEKQIKKDLELPEDIKLGSTMQSVMDSNSAKLAFGVTPPDLSVIARSRSADWLYSYMRSFYVDAKSASGWNNTTFPNVAMPFPLADLQGSQALHLENVNGHELKKLVIETPGTLCADGNPSCAAAYDNTVADLVNYLVFMSDPSKLVRAKLGYIVIGFLLLMFGLVYALKKEVWKELH